MQKFIDRVTTQILDETSLNDLHKIKLVLPSIRSINQVKKSLLNKKSISSIVKVNNVKVNNVKVLADEKISQPTEVFARVISYPTLHLACRNLVICSFFQHKQTNVVLLQFCAPGS